MRERKFDMETLRHDKRNEDEVIAKPLGARAARPHLVGKCG